MTGRAESHVTDDAFEPAERLAARSGPVLRVLVRNAGWILGGRGVAGVISIVYVAIAARMLGPPSFGVFSLILAFAGGFAALVTFQTSGAVIRYGSIHLAADRKDRLASLVGAMAVLDAAIAIAGAAAVVAIVPLVAPGLGWTTAQRHAACLFSAALLLSTGSTATGILRLFGRFDVLALTEMVGPLVRLAGSVLLWAVGGSLDRFLVVWALALLSEGGASWLAVLRLRRTTLDLSRASLRATREDNPQLGAFLLHNNAVGALAVAWQYSGILAVGALAGPAAAGGLRLAGKLAGALGKPVESLVRALYPELARLSATDDRATLKSVFARVTAASCLAAAIAAAAAALLGRDLLHLLYGQSYIYAAPLVLLLVLAAAVDLAGSALEPLLNAHGASGRLLAAHAIATAALLALLAVLVPTHGAIGAAWATLAGTIVLRGATAAAAGRFLSRAAA